ncbi:unnamed protein product [Plutella xylostella]|uniref:(diamondback moth) hypothetical protein n=1 Tax=Plutella xylostella TaxID=51655 RepID=A0A8S4EDY5_PLUXY|nr:unnamed protein product [Plutella xylostella]
MKLVDDEGESSQLPHHPCRCNIYIRHQETSTVRDIFLAPFSARLLGCVGAVALAAAAAVALASRLAPAPDERPMEYSEALLWATGILCQQGGNRTPRSPAAGALLVVCLLFAVVTYNSYAAFITSVLSVRVASVDTAAAVLYSTNFKIGYIRNGADQMYLMSTKDAVLNTFYIRGYSDAENLVSSAEEGLARAAAQDYAFFAGQRAARPVSLRAWAAQAPAWRLPPRGGESSRLPQAEDDTRARYLFLFRTSL